MTMSTTTSLLLFLTYFKPFTESCFVSLMPPLFVTQEKPSILPYWAASSSDGLRVAKKGDEYGGGGGGDDDDDAEGQTTYGNRSLAWTNRYRKLLPYEYARSAAMELGLRSKEEWDEHLLDGKVYHGPYLPSRPDEMYADDWVSWEEFLGICRTYNDARQLIQSIFRFKSMEEYVSFIQADSKRAEGLRLPLKPEIVYKDKGWVSEEHFLGLLEVIDEDASTR